MIYEPNLMVLKMNYTHLNKNNEKGFVLITSMLIMLVLTIVGIVVIQNSTTELRISGNDRHQKEAFYEADGGTDYNVEALEQNVACITGFNPATSVRTSLAPSPDPAGSALPAGSVILDGNITSIASATGDTAFWRNNFGNWDNIVDAAIAGGTIPAKPANLTADEYFNLNYPSDNFRDLYFPANYIAGAPHTNLGIEGDTKLTTGAAIQMAAGYEGKGKGISTGGAYMHYLIHADRTGINNSRSQICVRYRHMIGQEGDCYY